MQQLIYASADQIPGRQVGGWGVVHSTPDLTPTTSQRLQALTSVALPSTMPQFPSAQQLAARSVRYRVDPVGTQAFACHSVEAGTDHTGRPGNVVSHGALLPVVASLRPVDWFFSEGWATPYGPRQIADARLASELPAPGGWADTAAWLHADPSRIERLKWIVDVASTILLSTQRLALKAPTLAEAARWASVVSWLLDAATANQVRIRIGEDQATAVEQLEKVPVIVGVDIDLAPGSLRGLPVIDTGWQLDAERALTGGRWELPIGQSFPASGLTSLAADLVFADDQVAAAVFERRDELIARFRAEGNHLLVAHEITFLQAAWLCTPGAQALAREEPIRHLLAALSPSVRGWEEFTALAREIGEPAEADEPEPSLDLYAMAVPSADVDEPTGAVDVYALPVQTVDPFQVDEPSALEAALIAAGHLGKAGVDVEALVLEGHVAERIAEAPSEQQGWLRDLAAVLEPLETENHLKGEDL